MKDYIPEKPIIQSSSLSNDTIIYRASNPRLRIFELNVLEEIGHILNFRPSGIKIAREVIRRVSGENKSFSSSDAEFAEKIGIDIRKFVRGKAALKEDQQLSNFRFIFIPPRRVIEKDGAHYGVPTKYQPGEYWSVSDALQFQTQKIDIFALSVSGAQKEIRELLQIILADFGAKRIERVKREKEKKEKSPSLPCTCDCASCAACAGKSATGSEANGAMSAEKLRRQPNSDLSAELEEFSERFYQYLLERGRVDEEFRYRVKRAHHALEVAELRARDVMNVQKRSNLKLVGGQPK